MTELVCIENADGWFEVRPRLPDEVIDPDAPRIDYDQFYQGGYYPEARPIIPYADLPSTFRSKKSVGAIHVGINRSADFNGRIQIWMVRQNEEPKLLGACPALILRDDEGKEHHWLAFQEHVGIPEARRFASVRDIDRRATTPERKLTDGQQRREGRNRPGLRGRRKGLPDGG